MRIILSANVTVLTETVPEYAPAGLALVSATVLGLPDVDEAELVRRILAQMGVWFGAGAGVGEWRLLKIDRIERALPAFGPARAAALGAAGAPGRAARRGSDGPGTAAGRAGTPAPGVFVCGDRSDTPSLNGALASARRAAEAATTFLRRAPTG